MDDCIFCKIAAGKIPSYTLYEDDDFKVFLDRFPAGRGHALVITKRHFDDIYSLDPALAGGLLRLTAETAARLRERLGCVGLNILQNNGEAAGQTVKHLHVHLVPRYQGDKVILNFEQADPSPEELQQVLKELG